MKLLVLGGTVFVGRHIVEAAIARGHEVTLFHRGQHGKGLFPGVEEVFGDRDQDLDRLAGRRWDAVIDTSAYVPRQIEAAAKRLADAVDRYVFISTISVYDHTAAGNGPNEDSPLKPMPEPGVEDVTGDT
jgi:2'-hydroxyisoflavone reductase